MTTGKGPLVAAPERIVIVGGGLAGTRVAQALHRAGHRGTVTVVGDERHEPYDRPPLSKDVLRGDRDAAPLVPSWDSLGAQLRLGVAAIGIDSELRELHLADGTHVGYDALVIATGARAKVPLALGVPGRHVLRTIDDALTLRTAIREHGRVTIVGAGFIGCEVAASARAMGADVVLLEALAAPLVRVVGPAVGARVAALHMAAGVDVRCGVTVVGFRTSGTRSELVMADGTSIPADPVLVALGVAPQTEWLAGSSVAVDDGVVCDEYGHTSADNIWAAGDVARWLAPHAGEYRRHEHWTSAIEQAAVVARDIMGSEQPAADDVAYFWSDQYTTKFQMLGSPAPDDDVTILEVGPDRDRMIAVYARSRRLTGVIGASAPRWVMRMRGLVARGAPIDEAIEVVLG